MGESWALSQTEEALPENGSVMRQKSRLRLPGTARFIRVRTLALCVSVGLHVLAFWVLVAARLSAPVSAPPSLVEVEFVEIAGSKGGGSSGPASAAMVPASSAPVSRAVALADPAARNAEPAPQQPAASASTGGSVVMSGGGVGSGGGTGGGQGTGSGQSVGSGTGQGGAAVDRMPVVVRRIKPVYPMDARRRGISGQVLLRLFVDAEGGVRDVQVQAAEPAGIFEEKAVDAARKWRFEPAVFKGAPVGVWMTLPVRFALEDR